MPLIPADCWGPPCDLMQLSRSCRTCGHLCEAREAALPTAGSLTGFRLAAGECPQGFRGRGHGLLPGFLLPREDLQVSVSRRPLSPGVQSAGAAWNPTNEAGSPGLLRRPRRPRLGTPRPRDFRHPLSTRPRGNRPRTFQGLCVGRQRHVPRSWVGGGCGAEAPGWIQRGGERRRSGLWCPSPCALAWG